MVDFFDKDKSGKISQEKMSEVMKDKKIDEAQWKEIINECDEDQDGEINSDEFMSIMKQTTARS